MTESLNKQATNVIRYEYGVGEVNEYIDILYIYFDLHLCKC